MRNSNNNENNNNENKTNFKSTISLLILVVVLALGSIVYLTGRDNPILYGPYQVTKVVDGDTIYVKIDNSKVKVRMIGINTPESVHSDESKNTVEGRYASDYLKNFITETVYLEYDEEHYDKYDRTLAYVYLDDGETMIERVMLGEGLATTMTVEPNIRYADEFQYIMENAKDGDKGFWGTGFYHF